MPTLPIVQSCPHAGMDVPSEIADRLAIDTTDLYNDCDLWAAELYNFNHPDLAALIPAPYTAGTLALVTLPIARALIDANRYPDDLDNPDGPVKTLTSYGRPIYRQPLDLETKRLLLGRYWHPYHAALAAALRQHRGTAKLFLDCHNMAQRGPSAYADPGAARPLICLANLGDERGEPLPAVGWTSCPPALARRAADLAAEIFGDMRLLEPDTDAPAEVAAINRPFRGGYILDAYANPITGAGLPGLMIEVNRGLFVGNQRADTPMRRPDSARIDAVRRRLYRWAAAVLELLP